MQEVELHIKIKDEWLKADIDRNTRFPVDYLGNGIDIPGKTYIEKTKTIYLPRTRANSHIFGHIWQLSFRVTDRFNPLNRTPFRLYQNANLFLEGYIRLDKVAQAYEITLFGDLGDYFYTMMDEENKLKNLFSDEFDHVVNAAAIESFWGRQDVNAPTNGIKDPYTGVEMFNYALSYQGQYDNFNNHKQVVINEKGEQEVHDLTWLNRQTGETYAVESQKEHERQFRLYDTYISGEYRSYYQKPMVRVRSVFQRILSRLESGYGWKTRLDPTFFNNKNPYWNNLWMLMPNLKTSDSQNASNTEKAQLTDNLGEGKDYIDPLAVATKTGRNDTYDVNFRPSSGVNGLVQADRFEFKEAGLIELNLQLAVKPVGLRDNTDYFFGLYPESSKLRIIMWLEDESLRPYYLKSEYGDSFLDLNRLNTRHYRNEYGYLIRSEEDGYDGSTELGELGDLNPNRLFTMGIKLPVPDGGGTYRLKAMFEYFPDVNNLDYTYMYRRYATEQCTFNLYIQNKGSEIAAYSNEGIRSESEIGWQDICQSEATWYDFFMYYCKPFGLMFEKDDYNRQVTIMTRNTWYAKQQITDWTYKLDYNAPHSVKPLGFDFRVGIFKWKELGSKHEEDYKGRTGNEYGSFRFDNNYYFTKEERELFEGNIFSNCIVTSDYSNYYLTRSTDIQLKDTKVLPFLEDSSGSRVDSGLIFVFKDNAGKAQSGSSDSSNSTKDHFVITDDLPVMLSEKVGFCWNSTGEGTSDVLSCYPALSTLTSVDDVDYSINFGVPSISYGEVFSEESTVYYKFWRRYLMDRFNRNTKILTGYFNISHKDLKDILRKFIKINDTLWVVNRITDFDITRQQTVKVELISVNSMLNYSEGQTFPEGTLTILENGTELQKRGNTYTYYTDFSARTLTFTIRTDNDTWLLGDHDYQDIAITPVTGVNGQAVKITLPEFTGNDTHTYYIPFRLEESSRITYLAINQAPGVVIRASTNHGTIQINGIDTNELRVVKGSPVSIITVAGSTWMLGYLLIGGTYHEEGNITFDAVQDTTATAFWYDPGKQMKLYSDDEYNNTELTGYTKYYNFWIVNRDETLSFVNNDTRLTGYYINDLYYDPENPLKVIAYTNSIRSIYDTIIVALGIVNRSTSVFSTSRNIRLTNPAGQIIPSGIFGNVLPNTGIDRFLEIPVSGYGTYTFLDGNNDVHYWEGFSFDFRQGSGRQSGIIGVYELERLSWERSTIEFRPLGEVKDVLILCPDHISYRINHNYNDKTVVVSPLRNTGTQLVEVIVLPAPATRTLKIAADFYNKKGELIHTDVLHIKQEKEPDANP